MSYIKTEYERDCYDSKEGISDNEEEPLENDGKPADYINEASLEIKQAIKFKLISNMYR